MSDVGSMPTTGFTARGGKSLGLASLSGERRVDIAIVGGGIGGCAAALQAAENGAVVAILEANEVGWGSASRNSGHVAPATKHSLAQIRATYGEERGERIISVSENGPDTVFALAEKHKMDADITRCGILACAHSVDAFEAAKRKVEDLNARGAPAEVLSRQQTAEMVGNDYYLGGWFDRRGGTINTLAYVRGLARAAIAAGATIYEHSRVLKLRREGATWRLATKDGALIADRVILCTNAYTDDLWPGLRQSIIPARAYKIVTEPLPEHIAATVLPRGGQMVDTRRLPSGIRRYADGRLHVGAVGPVTGAARQVDPTPTFDRLRKLFPQAAPYLKVQHTWTGWLAMSAANAWKLHNPAPGLTAMIGCNGRGVAMATYLGQDLARHALGAGEHDLVLPFEPIRSIFGHVLYPPVLRSIVRYYGWRDAIDVGKLEATRPVAPYARPAEVAVSSG